MDAQAVSDLLLPGKYDNSPNKDRSLSNVTFADVSHLQKSIIGEIKP